jgi:hypothetical protein
VLAMMSANHLDRDLGIEIFVLDTSRHMTRLQTDTLPVLRDCARSFDSKLRDLSRVVCAQELGSRPFG